MDRRERRGAFILIGPLIAARRRRSILFSPRLAAADLFARTMDPDKAYRRSVRAWVLYDWANSAFVTTIMAAVYPIFLRNLAIKGGKSPADATAFVADVGAW